MCPICLSHDRHRAAWLFLTTLTDLTDGRPKRVLHFAPEPQLALRLRNLPNLDYLSADLDSPHALLRTDITAIDSPDAAFDILYCSHVLEHVHDDRKAIAEIFRVLKPGGWAIIQVPLAPTETTLEDPSITDPGERERLFWQRDHVRLYGSDIAHRLEEVGFDVRIPTVGGFVPAREIERQGLRADERIFRCTRLPDATEPIQSLRSE